MAEITKIHLVYFSPSGSTEKVVRKIASVITESKNLPVETHNLLTPASRQRKYDFGENDLVILGWMTAGMLFGNTDEMFACLNANNTPLIGLITYGNGYYGVALTEMKRKSESRGFIVTSLAAFVSRHSIAPTFGEGRPDSHDELIIADFAKRSFEKILSGDYVMHNLPKTHWSSSEQANKIIAYRETNIEPYHIPPSYKTKEISDACVKCGTCVRNCPVDAIDIENKTFDLERCIGCWGCVNRCPKHAVINTSKDMSEIMKTFSSAFEKRLEPEIFM